MEALPERALSCPPMERRENGDIPVLLALRRYMTERMNGSNKAAHPLFERIYRRSTPDDTCTTP